MPAETQTQTSSPMDETQREESMDKDGDASEEAITMEEAAINNDYDNNDDGHISDDASIDASQSHTEESIPSDDNGDEEHSQSGMELDEHDEAIGVTGDNKSASFCTHI